MVTRNNAVGRTLGIASREDDATDSAAAELIKGVSIPDSAENLKDFMDSDENLSVFDAKDSAAAFMNAYAAEAVKNHAVNDDIRDNVAEQRIDILKDIREALGVKRLPMTPQDGTHNPDAIGADLDGKFKTAGEFWKAIAPSTRMASGKNDPRLKVLNEAQADQGGFLVPEEFRVELMQIALEQAVIRPRATVIPMPSGNTKIPALTSSSNASSVFGGVVAYWTEESGSITASQPEFEQISMVAKKLAAYTSVTNELLADNALGLAALLNRIFPEAIAWYEDDAFINGSGSGAPLGILNSPALVSVAKETGQTATTIVWENLINMFSRMLPQSAGRGIWVANVNTFPQLAVMSLSVGTGGSVVWLPNGVDGPPASILGRPLIFTEKSPTLGAANDIAFIDPAHYLIGDTQAVTAAASEHVRFQNDETVYRFTERVDGRPWLSSAITPKVGSTLSPYVGLAARA
jgi:HK97 family phage major capsid protein